MEGWSDPGMEGWSDPGMEGSSDGGIERWRDGAMEWDWVMESGSRYVSRLCFGFERFPGNHRFSLRRRLFS
jgi:hypothetical protein